MNVEPVDFSEVDGDIPFPWRAPILEWLDKRIERADNVHKSYLSFTKRAKRTLIVTSINWLLRPLTKRNINPSIPRYGAMTATSLKIIRAVGRAKRAKTRPVISAFASKL